ncbi:MAG: hypothetical protein ACI8RD_008022, partial [Bacillariaceae sp.]
TKDDPKDRAGKEEMHEGQATDTQDKNYQWDFSCCSLDIR